MTQKPLNGIRVIDLTRVLAGPFCTMVLKDLGAEVVKVETPGTGDDARHFGPFLDAGQEKSAYFMSINAGKKSVTVNLKDPAGQEVLADLIRRADVLVENFRPGVMERLGFSDARVRLLNPEIVFASVSGFGQTGPDAKKPAYDVIIQGLSGLMSITGTEDGRTVRVGASISDITAGLYSAIGILAALFRRSQSGGGARLDIAMLDATVSVLENAIARGQLSDKPPGPRGTAHPSITPFSAFKTKDAEMIVAAGNDRLFVTLCHAIEMPALASDDRFKTNRLRTDNFSELRPLLEAAFPRETTDFWIEKLTPLGIPCARINNVHDLFDAAQLRARNMLVPMEDVPGFKVTGSPIKFMAEPDIERKAAAPGLGEHSREVLVQVLGYAEEKLAMLEKNGVIS